MTDLLLCLNNQLLTKNLYGMLRDEGYSVETADHPSLAVQMVLRKDYTAVVMDAEPFGLSVEAAIKIFKAVLPELLVIFIGYDKLDTDALSIEAPLDLAAFRQTIHELPRLRHLN
ncbi:MAG: hypothetical protein ACYC69_13695 [Thermodesulfovibrionales bacterium]